MFIKQESHKRFIAVMRFALAAADLRAERRRRRPSGGGDSRAAAATAERRDEASHKKNRKSKSQDKSAAFSPDASQPLSGFDQVVTKFGPFFSHL